MRFSVNRYSHCSADVLAFVIGAQSKPARRSDCFYNIIGGGGPLNRETSLQMDPQTQFLRSHGRLCR